LAVGGLTGCAVGDFASIGLVARKSRRNASGTGMGRHRQECLCYTVVLRLPRQFNIGPGMEFFDSFGCPCNLF